MSEVTFGSEETIRVADLVEGDWIEVIPSQHRMRGQKINSAVKSLSEGYGWTAGGGRGRRRTELASTVVVTRRGDFCVPNDFTVVVRREVSV